MSDCEESFASFLSCFTRKNLAEKCPWKIKVVYFIIHNGRRFEMKIISCLLGLWESYEHLFMINMLFVFSKVFPPICVLRGTFCPKSFPCGTLELRSRFPAVCSPFSLEAQICSLVQTLSWKGLTCMWVEGLCLPWGCFINHPATLARDWAANHSYAPEDPGPGWGMCATVNSFISVPVLFFMLAY